MVTPHNFTTNDAPPTRQGEDAAILSHNCSRSIRSSMPLTGDGCSHGTGAKRRADSGIRASGSASYAPSARKTPDRRRRRRGCIRLPATDRLRKRSKSRNRRRMRVAHPAKTHRPSDRRSQTLPAHPRTRRAARRARPLTSGNPGNGSTAPRRARPTLESSRSRTGTPLHGPDHPSTSQYPVYLNSKSTPGAVCFWFTLTRSTEVRPV